LKSNIIEITKKEMRTLMLHQGKREVPPEEILNWNNICFEI